MWKRGENAPEEQFLLFSTIFSICLTSGVKLHIHLLNMVVRFIVFFTSATLIFRGTDISKCFRKSLGIRDNQSRLYRLTFAPKLASNQPAHPHTDQSLRCPHEETLLSRLSKMRQVKILIGIHEYTGWLESFLVHIFESTFLCPQLRRRRGILLLGPSCVRSCDRLSVTLFNA